MLVSLLLATFTLSDSPNANALLAKQLMAQGNFAEAVNAFSKAIDDAKQPESNLHYQRATCLLIINKRQEALNDFSKVINLGNNQNAIHQRAKIYLQDGRFNDALKDLHSMLNKPQQLIADATEGGKLEKMLNKDCANDMQYLDRIIELSPMNVNRS
jgi:tetratricopeptide (TPR) repeat protein